MVRSLKAAQPRAFISYARSDGEEIANGVRTLLEQHAIPLRQDRANMIGRKACLETGVFSYALLFCT
jgi:hypothetical protein